jgi:hypothetical protein
MSRFEFQLATRGDDDELRGLLAATPMDGKVSLAFAREPSYFAAAEVDGDRTEVGVVRDQAAGRIVGMGSRSISLRYVNGQRERVGYLSGLRLEKAYRGRAGLLARGYQFLRELHADGRVSYYLTTIAEDNTAALNLLGSGRAGLPVYRPWGKYYTLVLSSPRKPVRYPARQRSFAVRQARPDDREAIVQFLNECGPNRQFFPAYESSEVFSNAGRLKGLEAGDVALALRDKEIVGSIGLWDQRTYKQTIVHSYRGWLRSLRPLYNIWARIDQRPRLPAAGVPIEACSAAIFVVRDDDQEVCRMLLQSGVQRLLQRPNAMLLVGLHERDPLLPLIRTYAGREYVTRLYLVHWPDEEPDVERLSERVPYLELGSL